MASFTVVTMPAVADLFTSIVCRRPSFRSVTVSCPVTPKLRISAAVLPVDVAMASTMVGVAAMMDCQLSASTFPDWMDLVYASIALRPFSALAALVASR